jgi:hypothetical protein
VNDKDVYDSMYTNESTLCFQCISVNNGYGCFALEESSDCKESYFSYQLLGCDHCIFSSNLSNKSYYAFNAPVSKEEFETIKQKYLNGSYTAWQKGWQKYLDMREDFVKRFAHNLNCENVTGDHLYNCRNCDDVFESFDAEDCLNSVSMASSKDVQNTYSAGWMGCEVVYSSSVMRGCKMCAFCTYTWFSSDMTYCDSCVSCDNCFGCIGLKHKKFCILNKQYSELEYRDLLPKIIEHMKSISEWGQMMPAKYFPYAYNESAAQDFFPLQKEEAVKLGYRWFDYEAPPLKVGKTIPASRLPDNLTDTPDDILSWAIECDVTGRPFKIVLQELKFYREYGLPIPRLHPFERHRQRMALRNPLQLFERQCGECGDGLRSSYAPDCPDTIYCEKCYLNSLD